MGRILALFKVLIVQNIISYSSSFMYPYHLYVNVGCITRKRSSQLEGDSVLSCDCWAQTSLSGEFAVGEA
ncbi:hypothetical protein T4A_14117 [Trichinella pseudospiralis]|uniref:Secreted protein n=1 Tax=Trichinella pseudospiralis TaxID=6337 RepID=A0A0V1DYR6_TRIPS|nr:hypothetical protein T4A_14117 [Trichinella pseudospiralis]